MRPPVCPICNRTAVPLEAGNDDFPFCSARCREVDLLRWCEGRYAIVEPLTPRELAEERARLERDE